MKYIMIFILVMTLDSYCSNSTKNFEKLTVKQYRNDEFIKAFPIDEIRFKDSGIYCLVYYDSSQTKLIDSSFYLNRKLNGYSLKRENMFFVSGNYIDGKRTGWFDYMNKGVLVQSNYYSNDTMYQSTVHSSGQLDSNTIFVPEIDMSFLQLSNRDNISQTNNWAPIKLNDSLLIYVTTGVNRFRKYIYNITDDLNQNIFEFNSNKAPFFKFKISDKHFRKYYLTLNVLHEDSLIYTKKELLLTTPFEK